MKRIVCGWRTASQYRDGLASRHCKHPRNHGWFGRAPRCKRWMSTTHNEALHGSCRACRDRHVRRRPLWRHDSNGAGIGQDYRIAEGLPASHAAARANAARGRPRMACKGASTPRNGIRQDTDAQCRRRSAQRD